MPKSVWIIDGDVNPLKKKLAEVDKLADKTGSKFEKIGSGGFGGGAGGGGGGFSGFLPGISAAVVGLTAIATGAALAVGGLLNLGGELETIRTQFGVFAGSVERGNMLLAELEEFANFTPFSNDQVTKGGRTLLAFGFAAEEIKPTLKILGDISAGTGKDLSELGVIFGQIKGAGRLMGGDLLQLINAGFNPLQTISEKTGRSMLDLKDDMSKGLITFGQVQQAFVDATSEGGLFNGMTEKLSNTFEGKLSTALGKGRSVLQKIGEKILPVFSKGLDLIVGLIDSLAAVDLSPLANIFRDLWAAFAPLYEGFISLFSSFDLGLEKFSLFQSLLDGLAFSFRITTLPLRVFITGLTLVAEAADEIRGAFLGIGDIIGGVFSMDPGQIARGFDAALNSGRAGISSIKQGIKDFAINEAKGFAGVLGNFGQKREAAAVAGFNGKLADGGDLGGGGSGTGTSKDSSSLGGGISGGGGIKNFTINIQNLVENIVFNKSVGQSEAELQAMIARALTAAVNETERLA